MSLMYPYDFLLPPRAKKNHISQKIYSDFKMNIQKNIIVIIIVKLNQVLTYSHYVGKLIFNI